MPRKLPQIRAWAVYSALLLLALIPAFLTPSVRGQDGTSAAPAASSAPTATADQTTPAPKLSEESEACMACHSGEMEEAPKVNLAAHLKSPHAEQDCQSCHTEYTPDYPHTTAMKASKVDCATCHDTEAFAASVHAKPDKPGFKGDHPTCASCHAMGADPHAIKFVSAEKSPEAMTRAEKTQACSTCHADKARMARYGVDPDAVPSYHESFHGKALLKFGKTDSAGCVDCHSAHNVQSPDNPAAPTNVANVQETCAKCHAGAKINFAMSGANHMRFRLKTSPILLAELWFFRLFVFGMLFFLMMGVALDVRRKAFGPHPPRSGRLSAISIAISFLLMAITLLLATFDKPGTMTTWIISLAFLALAFIAYFATRRRAIKAEAAKGGRKYPRLTLVLRLQHGLMAVAFTLLAITGLPQRFSDHLWLGNLYVLFGGFDNARVVHRIAAVVLIAVWVWHLLWLLVRWAKSGFSFRNWHMLPNKKDVQDFVQTSKYYLGMSHDEPKLDRFTFRAKMDYLAEYWGMPVMVLSGFVLWFPIYWGNKLPNIALNFAYIAHSYEATLAFLSIVTWHMYNSHFNPDAFPASNSWITGTLSREEMEREHPLELERIESGDKPEDQAAAGGPIPEEGPA